MIRVVYKICVETKKNPRGWMFEKITTLPFFPLVGMHFQLCECCDPVELKSLEYMLWDDQAQSLDLNFDIDWEDTEENHVFSHFLESGWTEDEGWNRLMRNRKVTTSESDSASVLGES